MMMRCVISKKGGQKLGNGEGRKKRSGFECVSERWAKYQGATVILAAMWQVQDITHFWEVAISCGLQVSPDKGHKCYNQTSQKHSELELVELSLTIRLGIKVSVLDEDGRIVSSQCHIIFGRQPRRSFMLLKELSQPPLFLLSRSAITYVKICLLYM